MNLIYTGSPTSYLGDAETVDIRATKLRIVWGSSSPGSTYQWWKCDASGWDMYGGFEPRRLSSVEVVGGT